MLRSAASDLGLHCLPRSQKRDTRLIRINILFQMLPPSDLNFQRLSHNIILIGFILTASAACVLLSVC